MALDEDLHEKMLRLAKGLLAGTRNGKVAWTPTDSEYKFLCSGTRSSATIESFEDRDGDTVSTLSLLNNHGTVVDSLKSAYPTTGPGTYESEEWNQTLDDLFYAARRVAYNVDDAIDSMLADIEQGISAPPTREKKADPRPIDDPWTTKTDPAGYSDEPPF